jgi:hypothetical protein
VLTSIHELSYVLFWTARRVHEVDYNNTIEHFLHSGELSMKEEQNLAAPYYLKNLLFKFIEYLLYS